MGNRCKLRLMLAFFQMDRRGNLWTLANKLPIILEKGLNEDEVNFSLYRVKPKDVIKGTVCAPSSRRDRAMKAVGPLQDDTDERFDEVVVKKEEEGVVKVEEEEKKMIVEEIVVEPVVEEDKETVVEIVSVPVVEEVKLEVV